MILLWNWKVSPDYQITEHFIRSSLMVINEQPIRKKSSWKDWTLPSLRIAISLAVAIVGYYSPEVPEIKLHFLAAYVGWSWFWGLVLLYPSFVVRVTSQENTLVAIYGIFHWGTLYICQSMLFGVLGGGIYRFIKDLLFLHQLHRSQKQNQS